MARIALGDVDDLDALAGTLVREALPGLRPDEHDELTAEAIVLAVAIFNDLPHGRSLVDALAETLPGRIIDRWRELHPEHRRNTRAGTTRNVEVGRLPDSDRLDEAQETRAIRAFEDEERAIESRLARRALTGGRARGPRAGSWGCAHNRQADRARAGVLR